MSRANIDKYNVMVDKYVDKYLSKDDSESGIFHYIVNGKKVYTYLLGMMSNGCKCLQRLQAFGHSEIVYDVPYFGEHGECVYFRNNGTKEVYS